MPDFILSQGSLSFERATEIDVNDSIYRKSVLFPYRIFGVGMNKTGTSTLNRAIQRLGIGPNAPEGAVHHAGIINKLMDDNDYEAALRFAGIYRFFEDRPWNIWEMYRRLDDRYPGSKFILTVRNPETWWKSVHRWITVTKPGLAETYRRHLKCETLNEKDMIAAYLRYNDEVRAYFQGRNDLLVVDFEAGDKWEPICLFLELPVPDHKFPHANRQSYQQDDLSLMMRRKIKKTVIRKNKPNNSIPGVQSCVNCGGYLELTKKLKRHNRLVSMPGWLKEPYRRLQRAAFYYANIKTRSPDRLQNLRKRYPDLQIDDMAIVTTFFNPSGYRTRTDNYMRFKKSIEASGLPLLTVELAFGRDPFILGEQAGDRIELRSPDPMWQKERMLNIGIARLLERGYRKIVWLDADVVYEEERDWPWYVAAALQEAPVCQAFNYLLMEDASGRSAIPGMSAIQYWRSIGSWLVQDHRGPSRKRLLGSLNGYSGFGWAARAEVLEQMPLYDRAILGGGDKMIYYACCPLPDNWRERIAKMFATNFSPCAECGFANSAPHFVEDYLDWAEKWNRVTGGQVSTADTTIRSLFHGQLANRFYRLRRDVLLRHGFNPSEDLALAENGCWNWSTEKPLLHHQVHSYFFDRKEDHL